MRIDVTQADIDKGTRAEPTRCPVAWAVRRATGQIYSVGCDVILPLPFDDNEGNPWPVGWVMPREASDWVRNFDMGPLTGKKVEPFSFEIDLPVVGPGQRIVEEKEELCLVGAD
jgi:hypothetical protein